MWVKFFEELPQFVKAQSFSYKGFKVNYDCETSEFLSANKANKDRTTPTSTLYVNVELENEKEDPSKLKYNNLFLGRVPLIKFPQMTSSGIVINGTRYQPLDEIVQSDGWYLKLNANKKKSIESIVKDASVNEDSDEEAILVDRQDQQEFETTEENTEQSKEQETSSEEELNDEDSVLTEEIKSLESDAKQELKKFDKEDQFSSQDLIGLSLEYRAPYGQDLIFAIRKKNHKIVYEIGFHNKGKTKYVPWFVFLRCIYNETAKEIYNRFKDFSVIREAYNWEMMLLSKNYSKDSSSLKIPNANGSAQDCARYVLNVFYGKGRDLYSSLDDTIIELHSRLERMKINTKIRNKNLFSFMQLEGMKLGAHIDCSMDDRVTLRKAFGDIEVGSTLTNCQLVILDSLESVHEITVNLRGKNFVFRKPEQKESFVEELKDLLYLFLFSTEAGIQPKEFDLFENKTVHSYSYQLKEEISRNFNIFYENFVQTYLNNFSLAELDDDSKLQESLLKFSSCFKEGIDINGSYEKMVAKLRASSSFQMMDNTNCFSRYAQGKQLKYNVGDAVPNDIREIQMDQHGFICPYSTSEGGNVGLNLYRTNHSIVEDEVIKKKFYVIKDGDYVLDDNGNKVTEYLSAGEVVRRIVADAGEVEKHKESGDSNASCYIGSEKVNVGWSLVQYEEIEQGANVSTILGSVPFFYCDGGKRGVMTNNTLKQVYPLLFPTRNYVDSGEAQRNDVGVIKGKDLLLHASSILGKELDFERTKICVVGTENRKNILIINYTLLDSSNYEAGEIQTFSYEVPSLTPSIKFCLSHSFLNSAPSHIYSYDDIVAYSNDVMIGDWKTSSIGNKELESKVSKFAPALGRSIKVAFVSYYGYVYEDSIVFNSRLVGDGSYAIMRMFTITKEIKKEEKEENQESGTVYEKTHLFDASSDSSLPDYLQSNGLPKPNTYLKPNDIVINVLTKTSIYNSKGKSDKPILKTDNHPIRLKSGKKDKGYVLHSSIDTYKDKDGTEMYNATVVIGYFSNITRGDKFTGGHGNKGTIGKIVYPWDMLWVKETGEEIDAIVSPTGVLPRNNLGAITEGAFNALGHYLNEVQIVPPFTKLNPTEMYAKFKENGIQKQVLVNGRTGVPYKRKVFVGELYYYRSEHDVNGKFNACSLDARRNLHNLAPAQGPGGAQRVGEMSTWAIMAGGAFDELDTLFSLQAGDVQASQNLKMNNYNENVDIVQKSDNTLNGQAKVLYRLLGADFQDYDSGKFAIITDELITDRDSSFSIENSSNFNDPKIYGDEIRIRSNDRDAQSLRSFCYGRCVSLGSRFIYPSVMRSKTLQSNAFYISSGVDAKSSLGLYLKYINANVSPKKDESKLTLKELHRLSDVTIEKIINQKLADSKVVVWLVGCRVPFVVNKRKWNSVAYQYSSFVKKVAFGYPAVLSIILGPSYLNNLNYKECQDDSVSLFRSMIYQTLQIVNSKNKKSSGVASVDYFEARKNTFELAKLKTWSKYNNQLNKGKLDEFLDYLSLIDATDMSGEIVANEYCIASMPSSVESYVIDIKELREHFSDRDLGPDSFALYSGEDEEGNETPKMTIFPPFPGTTTTPESIDDILSYFGLDDNVYTYYDLFCDSSCSYLWVPPKAYRLSEQDNPCMIDKSLKSIFQDVSILVSSFALRDKVHIITRIYNSLKRMSKNCISKLTDHSTRNAVLRDQVLSTRVSGSFRGYITVEPTYDNTTVGLPLVTSTRVFEEQLSKPDWHDRDSTLSKVIFSDFMKVSEMTDYKKKRKPNKTYIQYVLACLAENNLPGFESRVFGDFNKVDITLQLFNIDYESVGIKNTDSPRVKIQKVFLACKFDLKKVLNQLLDKYLISMERAPILWEMSHIPFYGKLIDDDSLALKLTPECCKAFNADFDGDQMAGYIAASEKARFAQKKLMVANRPINKSDGKPIVELNQDMVLGMYTATMEKDNKESSSVGEEEKKPVAFFHDDSEFLNEGIDSMSDMVENGVYDTGDYCLFSYKGRQYHDTIGRILLNAVLHPSEDMENTEVFSEANYGFTEYRYFRTKGDESDSKSLLMDLSTKEELVNAANMYSDENFVLKSRYLYRRSNSSDPAEEVEGGLVRIGEVVPLSSYLLRTDLLGFKVCGKKQYGTLVTYVQNNNPDYLTKWISRMKEFGFKYATFSGVSLDVFDMEPLYNDPVLEELKDNIAAETEEYKKLYDLGFKNKEEYSSIVNRSVSDTMTKMAKHLKDNLDRNNNLYILIDSGARGSFDQLVEIGVMIGISKDRSGEPILNLHESNFFTGLDARAYSSTAPNMRHALITSALMTGTIGEVTRKFVYTLEHELIKHSLCSTDSKLFSLKYTTEFPSDLVYESEDSLVEVSDDDDESFFWNSLVNDYKQSNQKGPDLLLGLILKYNIRHFHYKANGEIKHTTLRFRMDNKHRSLILYRTLDVCEGDLGVISTQNLSASEENNIFNSLKKQTYFVPHKDYTKQHRKILNSDGTTSMEEVSNPNIKKVDKGYEITYYTVTPKTVKYLEEYCVPMINIFLAMNCTCRSGICARCYGSEGSNALPIKNTAVGIIAAQSLGQLSLQVALNSHKSSVGSSVSSFDTTLGIIDQHNLGSMAITATHEGVLSYRCDEKAEKLFKDGKMYNSREDLPVKIFTEYLDESEGEFKEAPIAELPSLREMKKQNFHTKLGSYVYTGDLIYYDGVPNYYEMLRSPGMKVLKNMNENDLNPTEGIESIIFKGKLNMLEILQNIYGTDILARHLDILLRNLCAYGITNRTITDNPEKTVLKGTVMPISEMLACNITDFTPTFVSVLKNIQLCGKAAASQAMSYLGAQLGEASLLEKKSTLNSPLSCLMRGLSLDAVYTRGMTESQILKEYSNRKYNCSRYTTERELSSALGTTANISVVRLEESDSKEDSFNNVEYSKLVSEGSLGKQDTSNAEVDDLFDELFNEDEIVTDVVGNQNDDSLNETNYDSEEVEVWSTVGDGETFGDPNQISIEDSEDEIVTKSDEEIQEESFEKDDSDDSTDFFN